MPSEKPIISTATGRECPLAGAERVVLKSEVGSEAERPLPVVNIRSARHPLPKLPGGRRTAAYGKRLWRPRRPGWVVRRLSAFPAATPRSGPAAFGQTTPCRIANSRKTGRSALRPFRPFSDVRRYLGSGRRLTPERWAGLRQKQELALPPEANVPSSAEAVSNLGALRSCRTNSSATDTKDLRPPLWCR
jgi:hypothetical protein